MPCCPLCTSNSINLIGKIKIGKLLSSHGRSLNFRPDDLFRDIESLNFNKCKTCGLGFFSPEVFGDSDYYGKLALEDWYYNHDGKTEFDYAKKFLSGGFRVLDVGAGIGRFSNWAKHCEYQGIELSDKACDIARTNGVNVQKIDLAELASSVPNTFDVVVCFQVIEHIKDPKSFVQWMANLAKPGGQVIISCPNNDSPIFANINQNLNAPPHHSLLWNEQSLRRLAAESGLDVVEVFKEPVQDIHLSLYRNGAVIKWLNNLIGLPHQSTFWGPIKTFAFYQLIQALRKAKRLFNGPYAQSGEGHTISIVMRKP